MKLKNISAEARSVLPNVGEAFTCAPGGTTPELEPAVHAELLRDFPSVWEAADVKTNKKPKKEGA